MGGVKGEEAGRRKSPDWPAVVPLPSNPRPGRSAERGRLCPLRWAQPSACWWCWCGSLGGNGPTAGGRGEGVLGAARWSESRQGRASWADGAGHGTQGRAGRSWAGQARAGKARAGQSRARQVRAHCEKNSRKITRNHWKISFQLMVVNLRHFS